MSSSYVVVGEQLETLHQKLKHMRKPRNIKIGWQVNRPEVPAAVVSVAAVAVATVATPHSPPTRRSKQTRQSMSRQFLTPFWRVLRSTKTQKRGSFPWMA